MSIEISKEGHAVVSAEDAPEAHSTLTTLPYFLKKKVQEFSPSNDGKPEYWFCWCISKQTTPHPK